MCKGEAYNPVVPFNPGMQREDLAEFYGRSVDSVTRRVGSSGRGSFLCGWLPGGADRESDAPGGSDGVAPGGERA